MQRTVLAAVAASIIATGSVFARTPPPDTAPPPRGDLRPQQRLREAHDRLGITPAQQPQWDALVATLRDNARALRQSPAAQALRGGNLEAVQELRAAAAIARLRADAMQRSLPAVEALYAVLSPEQRQLADRDARRLFMRGSRG